MMALFSVIQKESWMKKKDSTEKYIFRKILIPNQTISNLFFKSPHLKKLDNEDARSCEGLLTIKECSEALCSARRQALMVSQLNFTDVSGMRSHSLWLTVLITALKMGSFQSLNG